MSLITYEPISIADAMQLKKDTGKKISELLKEFTYLTRLEVSSISLEPIRSLGDSVAFSYTIIIEAKL